MLKEKTSGTLRANRYVRCTDAGDKNARGRDASRGHPRTGREQSWGAAILRWAPRIARLLGAGSALILVRFVLVPLGHQGPSDRKAVNLDILDVRPHSKKPTPSSSLHLQRQMRNMSAPGYSEEFAKGPGLGAQVRGGEKKGTNGTIGKTVQLDSYKGQHVRGSIISASRHSADPGNYSSSSIEGEPAGRGRREGEGGGQMPRSARASNVQRVVSFLFVGCFAFGGYLIYALTLGRYSRLLLAHMRRKIGVFRGKDVTGVHVAELCMTAWSLLCVEAATYTHISIILPLVTCDDMLMQGPPEGEGFPERAGASAGAPSCEGSWSLMWRHFVPSAYFHVCFYFNWWMVIWGTSPKDAMPREQYHAAAAAAAAASSSRSGGRSHGVHDAAHDKEHWSAGSSMWHLDGERGGEDKEWEDCGLSGDAGRPPGSKGAGPLGTDGETWRGHYCRVCAAYVVRSDHHCPFLGVCVGAHNQAYFLALVLHMALSMVYGSAVALPAAVGCLVHSSTRPASPKCSLLLPIALGITFVAAVLCCFWLLLIYLTALNLTIREALSLDVLRFRMGPCRVWLKIRQGTDVRANIASVLGGHGWRAFAGLLVPALRRPAVFRPLDLPDEGALAIEGVYWHVQRDQQGGVASIAAASQV